MTDELERRLRDSLRAYGDLVEAPENRDLPARPRPATPASGLRGWRGAAAAAVAAAAVVAGSVWLVSADGDAPVSSAAGSARSGAVDEAAPTGETQAAAGAAAAPGETAVLPPAPATGVAYVVDLLTHCGVLGTDIGGVWFAADPPLVEGAGNPPSGWGNPYQRGTVTLATADAAVFADDAGHLVRLRADEAARPPLCD